MKLNVLILTILGCLTAWTYGLASENIGGNISIPKIEVQAKEEIKPLEWPTERHAYLYEVFQENYDKALLVLSGVQDADGKYICGGENKGLRPDAVNVNRDGSRDRGIFQINDKYHPLTDEQAFDYKQNIDYAYRMFKNDNYTFANRWVAGKCLLRNGYDI